MLTTPHRVHCLRGVDSRTEIRTQPDKLIEITPHEVESPELAHDTARGIHHGIRRSLSAHSPRSTGTYPRPGRDAAHGLASARFVRYGVLKYQAHGGPVRERRSRSRNADADNHPATHPGCETLLRYKVAIQGPVAQVGSGNLVGVTDAREQLSAATKRYHRTEAAHQAAREAVIMAVIAALRDGLSPTDVERLSPFSGAYIRKLAREHAIPPAPPGPKRASS